MRPPSLRLICALLVAAIAAVHFQQYVSFMSQIPTIGVLFLLNAAGGAGLAVALLSPLPQLRLLAGLGAIGLAAGSLVSIAVTLQSSLFGYAEPTLRFPILLAIIVESLALPALALLLREERGTAAAPAA